MNEKRYFHDMQEIKTAATAAEAFAARIAKIRELALKIVESADDHMGVYPDDVHWGHVGDAGRVIEKLNEALEVLNG